MADDASKATRVSDTLRVAPDGQATPTPAAIEVVLTEYLIAAEGAVAPRLQDFLARLASVAEREQFVDLVDQLAFADRQLPVRLRARVVLGGRYELVESIGVGGSGQVWRASDHKLQHDVAVKVLSLAAAAAFDVDRMVEREARLLARLSHPGIVRVIDTGTDGEHRYLVMELVGGRSLDSLIAELGETRHRHAPTGADVLLRVGEAPAGRSPVIDAAHDWPTVAARLLVELSRTLEAAHGVGVVHRDLKPANVRVLGGGAPVLLDFGIGFVRGVARGAATVAMFGTAQYSAPEQWQDGAEVDARTDVYQLGLVGYELLTFRRCFPHDNPMQLLRAIREQDFVRPRAHNPDVPPGLERCVLRAMETDPARRYPTAAAFRADLERWLAGVRPLVARPFADAGWRVRRFGRRYRHRLVLVAAALTTGIAGFVLSRGTDGVAVEKLGPDTVRFDRDTLVTGLFRIQRNGQVFIEPAEFAGQDASGVARYPGGVVIELRPISVPDGDAQLSIQVSGATDVAGGHDLRILGEMLQAMGRELVRRGGEPLSEAEAKSMLQAGRATLHHELPIDRILAGTEWQVRGVRSIVL